MRAQLENIIQMAASILTLPSALNATKLGGIIEADKILFAYSKKLSRKPRKRGMKAKSGGAVKKTQCQY